MAKIGFLGGSFNPPHAGHIELAMLAKRNLGLDFVVFLVTPCNPFKTKNDLPSILARKKMLEKIAKNSGFKISTIEKKFKVAQSFRTVRLLKKIYENDDLYFIFGSDNMSHFHKWQNFKEILRSVNVIFVNRGGHNLRKTIILCRLPHNSYKLIYTQTHEISSTVIRNQQN